MTLFFIIIAALVVGLIAETMRMVYSESQGFQRPPRSHHGDVFETRTFV